MSKLVGVVLLYKRVYRVTAGGNKHVCFALGKNFLVLLFDYLRAYRGLLDRVKTQLFQGVCHRRKSNAVISGKRGRKARDDLFSVSNGVLYPVNIVFDLLGVLGTDNIAGTAEDTVVLQDMRLIARKFDRLNRTVPYALVAVPAIGSF